MTPAGLRPLLPFVPALAAGVLAAPDPACGQEVVCEQARKVVDQVAAMYAEDKPDHELALRRLAPARDLCPSLGRGRPGP